MHMGDTVWIKDMPETGVLRFLPRWGAGRGEGNGGEIE